MNINTILLVLVLGVAAYFAWRRWGPGSLERELRARMNRSSREEFEREVRRWD